MRRFVSLALVALWSLSPAAAQPSLTLVAPDGQTVTVERDAFGVPSVSAPTEAALFFGQGFAVAQDRLFQMETFWRAATGRLAEIQGPAALAQDQQVRTVAYTPAERAAQFSRLRAPVRAMLDAYLAGVNAYIDSTETRPAVYRPVEYTQFPLNARPVERWDRDKLVAVLQFFMRRFGEIGGQELTRLAELDAQGAAWFEANRPVNDPAAPTTISNAPPPGAQGPGAGPGAAAAGARYDAADRAFAAWAAPELARRRAASDALLAGLGVPTGFGSFAATVAGSLAEGPAVRAMLLGAPQMGLPTQTTRPVTSEVELAFPGGQVLRGMTVPGIPGVIIGTSWRVDSGFSWTLTTGYTDNTDTYLAEPVSPTQYRYAGEVRDYEVLTQSIAVLGQAPVSYTHLRTVHGPVYLADAQRVAAWKYAFWERELDMVEAFYDVWQAADIEAVETAGRRVSMSFNVFYADSPGNTAFWHVGRYPLRPGAQDPRLPARADGSGEWTGTVPFEAQPQERNPAKGYFVNWNNKPAAAWNQGDNVSWRPGLRTYDGVSFLEAQIRGAAPGVSAAELNELFRTVRSNGTYPEYPGTYQQVARFAQVGVFSCPTVAFETVVPPGQSGFVSAAGVPSPHLADQWALYQSSAGSGAVQLKNAAGRFAFCLPGEGGPGGAAFRLGLPAPNPATGTVALRLALAAPADVRVTLHDALGREVAVLADGPAAGEAVLELDTRALAPGVYVVRALGGGHAASRRVVVAR